MKIKSVVYVRESTGNLRVVIGPMPDWEGFEELVKFMQVQYGIVILAQYDGPDARRWILEKNGCKFELIHDDGYGNYLFAPTADNESVINEIGKDLEQIFERLEGQI